MARRRLCKSYFYVEYDGQKYLNGGTAIIPSFEATGGTDSFTIHSSKSWEINNKPTWLTLSKNEGERGSTPVTITAAANSGSDQRTGELHVGLKNFLSARNINIDLSQRTVGSVYIDVLFNESPVAASVTSNTFTLDCAGINLSTLGYYAAGSNGIASCNLSTSSVTIAENTGYTDRVITLAITGTSTVGNPVTGTAQFTQSKKVVSPSLGITYIGAGESAAAGSTTAFTLTKNYVTAITAYSVTPNTATATTTGQTGLTVQYPANQTENTKQYTVSVSGTDVYGTTQTASTTFNQAADSYTMSITPASYTAAATEASYNGFVVSSSNVSNTGLSYTGAITGATRTGNNIKVDFGQNQTSSSRSGSVTITGKTVAGRTVSASASLTQNAAGATSLSITYTGNTLTSQAGSTSAFNVVAQNVTITSYDVNHGATATTISSGVRVDYPANTDGNNSITYTVTVWGTDEFSQVISASTTFTQAADSYTLSITPASYTAAATATSYNGFTVASSNVSNTGLTWTGIITSASRNGNSITVNFEENQTSSVKSGSVTITGKTVAGRTVSATANLTQNAAVLPDPNISLIVSGKVTAVTGGDCTRLEVRWSGLTVGSYIDLSCVNAQTSLNQIEVTASTGSKGFPDEPTVPANTGSTSRTVSVTATWRDNTSVRDTYSWTQEGMYTVYNLTVRGYNDDTNNTFDGVNDTPYVVQEYRMNCNTSIGNFGTLREIDIHEYDDNSFGLAPETVSGAYDDTYADVTLTINPKSSSGNHPAYCTLQWSLDDYSDYKVAYDSNLNQYRFDSSISYPAGTTDRIFYIKKITFSDPTEFKVNLKVDFSTNPQPISSGTTGFTISTEPNDSTTLYTIKVDAGGTIITSTTGNFSAVHSIGENPLTDARQYTVYVIVDDTVVESVSITQEAKAYFKWNDTQTSATSVEVIYRGGTVSKNYTTNIPLTSLTRSNSGECVSSVSISKGVVTAGINMNSDLSSREGGVMVISDSKVVGTFGITQNAFSHEYMQISIGGAYGSSNPVTITYTQINGTSTSITTSEPGIKIRGQKYRSSGTSPFTVTIKSQNNDYITIYVLSGMGVVPTSGRPGKFTYTSTNTELNDGQAILISVTVG